MITAKLYLSFKVNHINNPSYNHNKSLLSKSHQYSVPSEVPLCWELEVSCCQKIKVSHKKQEISLCFKCFIFSRQFAKRCFFKKGKSIYNVLPRGGSRQLDLLFVYNHHKCEHRHRASLQERWVLLIWSIQLAHRCLLVLSDLIRCQFSLLMHKERNEL